KLVRADGRRLLTAPTKAAAREIARQLESLRTATASERGQLLDKQATADTDLTRLREARATQRSFAFWQCMVASLLFVGLFGLLPWQVYFKPLIRLDLLELSIELAILLLAGSTLAAVQLHRVRKRLGLGLGASAARATMLLLPFAALHPLLHVSRELYVGFHWSVLAAALLPREEFLVLARQEMHRLAFCAELAAADRPLAGAWERELGRWKRVLRLLEVPREQVLDDPALPDSDAAAYCPLCSASFRAEAQRCADCDVPLRKAPAPRSTRR
ncbi:MAG: hypothetical protein HY901_33815, partial [Deltaproteobacteria bacterium]|nr:hypothetical protein [Deltaproteobacteria bacterium]